MEQTKRLDRSVRTCEYRQKFRTCGHTKKHQLLNLERVLSDGEPRQMLLLLRPRDCRSGRTSVNGDASNNGLAHKNAALVLSLSRCCFLGQLDLASNFKEKKECCTIKNFNCKLGVVLPPMGESERSQSETI